MKQARSTDINEHTVTLQRKRVRRSAKKTVQVEAPILEEQAREEIRKLQIPSEAEPIVRSLAKVRAEMLSDSQGQKAAETVGRLEGRLARAKKLYVTGDYSGEEYRSEKRNLDALIEEENGR